MLRRFPAEVVIFGLFFLITALGCQDGYAVTVSPSQDNPVSTVENPDNRAFIRQPAQWGYWHVFIDPQSEYIDILPVRTNDFAANVNLFLEPGGEPAGNIAISLDPANSDPGNNLIAVDVTLHHPLKLDMYSGFDVRGILIHNGSVSSKSVDGIAYAVAGNCEDAVLLNADGWTRWWNPREFTTPGLFGYVPGALSSFDNVPTATMNGHKIFADGLDEDDDFRDFITSEENYSDRAWFSSDSTNSRKYIIQFPIDQPLEFDYCIYACWNMTSPDIYGDPDEYEPGDWPIDTNCAEAFYLVCDSSKSTAYYYSPTENGGSIILDLEVFDWQGAFGNGITDEISEIRIESRKDLIADNQNTIIISQNDLESIANVSTPVSSVYSFEISDLNLTGSGTEDLLISVISEDPDDYDSGFGADYPVGAPLAAFLLSSVEIIGTPCPDPQVESIYPDCLHTGSYIENVTITGSGFIEGPSLDVILTDGAADYPADNVAFVNDNKITCDLDLSSIPPGTYDVVAVQGCNPSAEGVLNNGFVLHDENTGSDPWIEVGYDSNFDIRDHPGATEIILGDNDSTGNIEFFDFDYYGITYNHFSINSNGAIRLASHSNAPASGYSKLDDCGEDFPYIIPFGEDLDPDEGNDGRILFEIMGNGSERTLTVMWDEVASYYSSSGNPGSHTFSVTLFELDNHIRMQFEHPNALNTGDVGGDPPIALCNFELTGFNSEQHELFCELADWPDSCSDFRAYDAVTPVAEQLEIDCVYRTDYTDHGYNPEYECSISAVMVILGDNDNSAEIPLGFTFSWCGTEYTNVYINSNGILFLGDDQINPDRLMCSDFYRHTDCISANSDDLHPENGGEIKYETRIVGSDRVFIVEWDMVPSAETGSSNTFQIVLFDSGSTTCDPAMIQWDVLHYPQDTLIQYRTGFEDLELCIFDGGGQYENGSILIEPM